MKKHSKHNKILVLTSLEATKMKLPKYNPYQTGHGPHGKSKYCRSQSKKEFEKEVENSASFNFQQSKVMPSGPCIKQY